MQHFVKLCESLHTFGQHAVYGSLVTMFIGLAAPEDGVTAVGQYKYPRRRPRLEVMLHVIHFSEGRSGTALETWYCLETRRACHSSRGVQNATSTDTLDTCRVFLEKMRRSLQRKLTKGSIIVLESRNDSVTAGPADSLTWSCTACLSISIQAKRAIAYGHIGYKPSWSLFSPLSV